MQVGKLVVLLSEFRFAHNCAFERQFVNDCGKQWVCTVMNLATWDQSEAKAVLSTTTYSNQQIVLQVVAEELHSARTQMKVFGVPDVCLLDERTGRIRMSAEIKSDVDLAKNKLGHGQLLTAMLAAFVQQEAKWPVQGVSVNPCQYTVFELKKLDTEVLIQSHGH